MKYTENNVLFKRFQAIVTTMLLLLLWQLAAWLFPVKFLLAGPLETFRRLAVFVGEKEFWLIVVMSTARIIGGLLCGVLFGIFIACLAKLNTWLRSFWNQLTLIFKSIPITLIIIILLILFSNQNIAGIAVFTMSFPIIYTNYLSGLEQADIQLLEMAKVFGWRKKQIWRLIYLQAAQPYLVSSLKIVSAMAWKAGIAAEIIGMPLHSFGEKIYLAKIFLDTADIFAYALSIFVLSFATEKIICFGLVQVHQSIRGIS